MADLHQLKKMKALEHRVLELEKIVSHLSEGYLAELEYRDETVYWSTIYKYDYIITLGEQWKEEDDVSQ